MPLPYCKQILIPFGEYIPGASIFPWLNKVNDNAGRSLRRHRSQGISVPDVAAAMANQNWSGPLRSFVMKTRCQRWRAERPGRAPTLLVNMTFDTWFGETAAPFQHHLIAAFRAIENRRYLVRASNSGYSAVVDPIGRTIASIRPFAPGTLECQGPLAR